MEQGSGDTLFDRIALAISGSAAPTSSDARVETDLTHAPTTIDDDEGSTGVVIEAGRAWPAPDISTQMERPSITERQCSRTGCSDAAAVTLSYHYAQSQVWIDRLSPEREPHTYDMCDRHAQRLSVPRGWHLDDRRGARRGSLIAV